MRLTGPQGAVAVVHIWGETLWPVSDKGCVMDVDTLDDLRKAERLLAARAV